MKKSIYYLAISINCIIPFAGRAQNTPVVSSEETKEKSIPIYGEFGLGFGQTIIPNATQDNLTIALGGAFEPVGAGNLTTAFYYAPVTWKGLGIGTRLMWSGGPGAIGENGDDYFFNYYNFSISAKYYVLSRKFNKGLYTRVSLGTGQLTTKRANDASNSFTHQFAIGSTLSANVGYSLPFKQKAISLEFHYETSSRSGTIDGVGDKSLRSSQLGANIVYSF